MHACAGGNGPCADRFLTETPHATPVKAAHSHSFPTAMSSDNLSKHLYAVHPQMLNGPDPIQQRNNTTIGPSASPAAGLSTPTPKHTRTALSRRPQSVQQMPSSCSKIAASHVDSAYAGYNLSVTPPRPKLSSMDGAGLLASPLPRPFSTPQPKRTTKFTVHQASSFSQLKSYQTSGTIGNIGKASKTGNESGFGEG
jgi:hypothetical protein